MTASAEQPNFEPEDAVIIGLITHAAMRKVASRRGWWMTDNFTDVPGRVSVDLFASNGLRPPRLRALRAILPMPVFDGEVVAARQNPDCAILEPIISYDGTLGQTFRDLVHGLPNLRQA